MLYLKAKKYVGAEIYQFLRIFFRLKARFKILNFFEVFFKNKFNLNLKI